MSETFNPVPKCRICQKHHWLRDGCAGDFQARKAQSPAPRTPRAPTKRKRKKGKP